MIFSKAIIFQGCFKHCLAKCIIGKLPNECALPPQVHYVSDREASSSAAAAVDEIVFEIEFVSSSPSRLPRRFARRHRFVLPVTIEPAERHETDGGAGGKAAPEEKAAGLLPEILDASKAKPIRLVKGTKRQLGWDRSGIFLLDGFEVTNYELESS